MSAYGSAGGSASERVSRWTRATLPVGFDALAKTASEEGHLFLVAFEAEWSSGVLRFDGPGECLFIASVKEKLVGIGGICQDPYQQLSDVGRLRHVYVAPAFRSRGHASRLVRACLDCAGAHFRVIRLKTNNPVALGSMNGSAFSRSILLASE